MKKSELRLMVREIVREEVALSIKEVIKEMTTPSQNLNQVNNKKEKIEKQSFSSNSIINEVLNETADTTDEWTQMGGGTYDSSRMNEVLKSSYDKMDNSSKESSADAMVASMGINPNSVTDPIKNMFTKDYRSIMKKVDEKSKQKRGL